MGRFYKLIGRRTTDIRHLTSLAVVHFFTAPMSADSPASYRSSAVTTASTVYAVSKPVLRLMRYDDRRRGGHYASPDDRQLGDNGPDTGDGSCCHRSGSRISWWRDLSSRTSRTGGARTGSARTGIRRPSSGACDRAQSSCRAIRICAISAHDYCSAGRRIVLAVCLAGTP